MASLSITPATNKPANPNAIELIHRSDLGGVFQGTPQDAEAQDAEATAQSTSLLHDQTSRLPFRRLISAYLCLAAIYFISTLDINSVATALPAMGRSLDAGASITWAGTAYLMGQTAFQPLYGRLSDIFGRKPILLLSVGFLIVGDVLCGFARTPTWLYVCRALSGVGGGGISSLVQITVSDLVSLKDRGKYQGMLSASIGMGAGTGPFIAAGLLSRQGDEGWRWIFWVPPILAATCLAATWVYLPLRRVEGSWGEKLQKIDWFGLCAVVAAVVFFLIPINSGGSIWAWNSPLVISMLVLGAFFLVLFALIEKRFARIPIIPMHLFTRIPTAVLYLQCALYDAVWQVDLYFLPIYFQDVRRYTPLQSAAFILPLLLVHSTAGVISGPIMSRTERYGPVLNIGMGLWALGAGLRILFSRTTPSAVHVIVLMIEGTGIGFVHQPALVALQALCSPEDRAVATSTRNLLRMVGAVTGLASSTALQFAVMTGALPENLPAHVRAQVLDGSWKTGVAETEAWDSSILDAKMQGVRAVFILLSPLVGLCLIGCYFVPSVPLRGDDGDSKSAKRPEGGAEPH
ncbi:MFS general substrate transporter [Thozetella sp. PMI_491]|nr:MFS general substrate transporter [Thozetella sp. PMI_491]